MKNMELLQTRLPIWDAVETPEKDKEEKNKRKVPNKPRNGLSLVAPPLFDIEQIELSIEVEEPELDREYIAKILKFHEREKGEIEAKLSKIEDKARKFYVYLIGAYNFEIATRYLDLVSTEKYLRRNPVINDSIDLEDAKEVA